MRTSAAFIAVLCAIPAVFFGCGKAKGPAGAPSLYTVKHTTAAPVIDGVLEDECWKTSRALDFVLCENGGKPRQPTTLRMVCDSTYLYLAFECQDLDAASEVTQFDGPVEDQECIALLIDAGCDSTGYFMIAVAPTGAVHDAYVLNRKNGAVVKTLSCWNCEKLRASVSVYGGGPNPGTEDRFWTVEMAIPFSELMTAPRIPPGRGDAWRMNFYRIELTGGRELSAAVPTGAPDMHRPYAFAAVSFGD